MFITTITPVRYALCVRRGVGEFSDGFPALVESLTSHCPELNPGDWTRDPSKTSDKPQYIRGSRTAYSDISHDDRDIRLAFWRGELDGGQSLTVHMFNNRLAIVEIDLQQLPTEGDQALDEWAECASKALIARFEREVFLPLLERLKQAAIPNLQICGHGYENSQQGQYEDGWYENMQCLWVGRCLRLTTGELTHKPIQTLVKSWLSATIRPADATDIIDHKITHSLRWLNYVVVETKVGEDHYKMQAMVLAQYFYSIQHIMNEELFKQISDVFLRNNLKSKEERLKALRADAQLHVSTYYESRSYLARPKKLLLVDILAQWDFKDTLANTERMIDVCSTRLNEITSEKRSRAEVMTDILLAAIGFFAIFELVLEFVSYSRELVTNPTLSYVDQGVPWVFVQVASWNIDMIMLTSLLIVGGMIGLYTYVKNR